MSWNDFLRRSYCSLSFLPSSRTAQPLFLVGQLESYKWHHKKSTHNATIWRPSDWFDFFCGRALIMTAKSPALPLLKELWCDHGIILFLFTKRKCRPCQLSLPGNMLIIGSAVVCFYSYLCRTIPSSLTLRHPFRHPFFNHRRPPPKLRYIYAKMVTFVDNYHLLVTYDCPKIAQLSQCQVLNVV